MLIAHLKNPGVPIEILVDHLIRGIRKAIQSFESISLRKRKIPMN